MNADDNDLVEKLHREAMGRFWKQQEKERALVEEMHREAANQGPQALPSVEPPTVHYSELPEAKPDSPLCREWNYYRREVGRLLAEGQANGHVLIKGEQIIGIWDTHEEAMAAGYRHFLGQPFLVHQIQERERGLRSTTMRLCRNLPFRYHLAS